MRGVVILGALVALASPAWAAKAPPVYLSTVESPVYEAPGDVKALARRGQTCIAQLLSSGLTTAPTLLNADLEGGVVVARNAFQYHETVFGSPLVMPARTRVTFEARENRFRVTHNDIEVLANPGDWRPIRQAKPGKRDEMHEQLDAISDRLAACVKAAGKEW